jgi:hypothetical protein
MNKNTRFWSVLLSGALVISGEAVADEGLFGYVKGAEPLPKGSWHAEQWFTWRGDRFVDAAVELSDDQRKAIHDKSGVRQRWRKQALWRAEKA